MNDMLDKFRARLAAARKEIDSVQSDYDSLIREVINHRTDYSFVKSDNKRSELEMLSRQTNLIINGIFNGSGKERFDSICRLVHKQMEGVLKYLIYEIFLSGRRGGGEALQTFILDYNAKSPSNWEDINPASWRSVKFYQLITYMSFIEPDSSWFSAISIFNDYRNTLSHFGYFDEVDKIGARDAKFKKFASERPYLLVLDLLEDTVFKAEYRIEKLRLQP